MKMMDSLLVLPGSVIAGRDELREGFGEDEGLVARLLEAEPLVRVHAQLTHSSLRQGSA